MTEAGGDVLRGKTFLSAEELALWSRGVQKTFWAPDFEIVDNDSELRLIVDMPGCKIEDVRIAVMPRVAIVRQDVRLLAARSWKEAWNALFGTRELFRRFDLPALIDVNRVKAELEMGVLTVLAPKQKATKQNGSEQPAEGVPDRPHAVAA